MADGTWKWLGVDFNGDSTYSWKDYKPHPIREEYASVKTTSDLKGALDQINSCFFSPTACEFKIKPEKDGAVGFYHDKQDGVTWAWEVKTGHVFATLKKASARTYVAASLAEFLSHIQDEAIELEEKYS